MASALYTVKTSINPGTPLQVDQAELERLQELGVLDQIVSAVVPYDRVEITDGQFPQNPRVGLVWFNRAISA